MNQNFTPSVNGNFASAAAVNFTARWECKIHSIIKVNLSL